MNPYESPQTPIGLVKVDDLPRRNFELSRPEKNPGAVKSAALMFTVILVVTNVLITLYALGAGGWGGLWMIMMIGPAINLGSGITGLFLLPGVIKAAQGSSVALFVAAIVGLPFAAMLIDGLIIQLVGMRGGC